MCDETYNGWKNRETWALMLHINNDQGLQETFHQAMRESIGEDGDNMFIHADAMKDTAERWMTVSGYLDEIGDMPSLGLIRVIEDIGSLWRVDWDEVAKHIFDDVDGHEIIADQEAEDLIDDEIEDDDPARLALGDIEETTLRGLDEVTAEIVTDAGDNHAVLYHNPENMPQAWYGYWENSLGQHVGYRFRDEAAAYDWIEPYQDMDDAETYCAQCNDWH